MLEEPSINQADILAALRDEYGFSATEIDFLPLGADVNTAAYRIATNANHTLQSGSISGTTG